MDLLKCQFQRSMHSPGRIFVDASHTIATGRNSGIERVVRSVLAECSLWCRHQGLPTPQVVTHHGDHFFQVDDVTQRRFSKLAALEANVQQRMPGWYIPFAQKICDITKSKRLRKWLLPQPGHLGLFKLAHTAMDRFARGALPWRTKHIAVNKDDVFLLPDAYWTRRGVWRAAHAARKHGATTATVIYDLIPLTHPQYVGKKRSESFRKYLHQAIEHSDLMVAISKTVEDELRVYIQEHLQEFERIPTALRHVTLGAELKLVQGEVREGVRELFGDINATNANAPYLMVATFDPRKNHHYLLDAFDLLWQKGADFKLCLIGRVGSLCDDVVQRIRSHPELGKKLFAIHDMKDAELQYCYQTCRGVIFPSVVEGFGLPIVESLWFGKKTFASDTPIHREVGRQDCTYFDLKFPGSLANEIEKWEQMPSEIKEALPIRRPTTWEECSKDLLMHCLESHQQRNAHVTEVRVAA